MQCNECIVMNAMYKMILFCLVEWISETIVEHEGCVPPKRKHIIIFSLPGPKILDPTLGVYGVTIKKRHKIQIKTVRNVELK